jgi:hypothetical protein
LLFRGTTRQVSFAASAGGRYDPFRRGGQVSPFTHYFRKAFMHWFQTLSREFVKDDAALLEFAQEMLLGGPGGDGTGWNATLGPDEAGVYAGGVNDVLSFMARGWRGFPTSIQSSGGTGLRLACLDFDVGELAKAQYQAVAGVKGFVKTHAHYLRNRENTGPGPEKFTMFQSWKRGSQARKAVDKGHMRELMKLGPCVAILVYSQDGKKTSAQMGPFAIGTQLVPSKVYGSAILNHLGLKYGMRTFNPRQIRKAVGGGYEKKPGAVNF